MERFGVNRPPLAGNGGDLAQILQINEWFVARIDTVTGSGASATYGLTEINVVGGVGGDEDRVSGRIADAALNAARAIGGVDYAVDDLVIVRRNVAYVNEWEIIGLAAGGTAVPAVSWIKRGKLDATLNQGSSATMSVWRNVSGTMTDTTENITVYAWNMATGQSVVSGLEISAAYEPESDTWFIVSAECP